MRITEVFSRVGLLAASALVVASCSSDNELRSGPGCTSPKDCPAEMSCISNICAKTMAPPVTECFIPTSSSTCKACIDAKCLAQCVACQDDADCASMVECLSGCPDTTCVDNCITQHQQGFSVYLLFGGSKGCKKTLCASECS